MREASRVVVDCGRPEGRLEVRRHTLGQGGVDDPPFSDAVVERLKVLRPPGIRLFVQEFFSMMEAPGRYDWKAIDAAVQSIRRTGAAPFLALCMKPPCLYPKVDQKVTEPSSWKDWEDFVAATARHFAEDLRIGGIWYEVGNEPDIGEDGGCPYLFAPDGYAEYYAHTARAILKGDPKAKVGGPALARNPLESPFPKALARRVKKDALPLDFFSWHTYTQDSRRIADGVAPVVKMLRELGEPFASATTVLGEWNATFVCNLEMGEFLQGAFLVDAAARMLDTDLDRSYYYHIMDMELRPEKWRGWFSPKGLDAMSELWISSHRGLHMLAPDGEPSAAYVAFRMLYEMEGERLPAERPSEAVGVLASRRENTCRVLLWNYHFERVQPEEVALEVTGLPGGAFTEKRYRLGGKLTDMKCVSSIRRGEMFQVHEEEHPGGNFETKLTLLPYTVQMVVLSW